jgi:hypothetical protein
MTPDDSARLHRVGIIILRDLAFFSTFTMLHGNDIAI